MDQFHSDDFLLYAYLQSGQDAAGQSGHRRTSAAAIAHFEAMPNMGDHYMTGMFPYYRTKLPIILRFGDARLEIRGRASSPSPARRPRPRL